MPHAGENLPVNVRYESLLCFSALLPVRHTQPKGLQSASHGNWPCQNATSSLATPLPDGFYIHPVKPPTAGSAWSACVFRGISIWLPSVEGSSEQALGPWTRWPTISSRGLLLWLPCPCCGDRASPWSLASCCHACSQTGLAGR